MPRTSKESPLLAPAAERTTITNYLAKIRGGSPTPTFKIGKILGSKVHSGEAR